MSKTVLSSSLAASLLEQHFQIGCQLQDKILRYAVLDEWAGELAIKNVRCLHAAPEQHDGERTVILSRRPEKSLKPGMGGVERPKTASLFDAPAPATPAVDQDEEEEILGEAAESAQIDEELDDAA